MTLRPDDALAADLLLNADTTDHPSTRPAGSGPEAAIARISAVLSVLDRLPADAPPADLVARTLGRIERRVGAESIDAAVVRPGTSLAMVARTASVPRPGNA